MTINAQSGVGRIRLFNDCFSIVDTSGCATNTDLLGEYNYGDFRLFGDGMSELDAGAKMIGSDEISGVARLTTTNETEHGMYMGTPLSFDVGLMGPIIVEARVRFNNLDTKSAFVGLTDEVGAALSLETSVATGTTTAITLTASDICGFYLSSELTDDEDWHGIYNGGTTTGETTAANCDLDDDAVAGEWQILRLEVDPNGTARWYIDGDLKQTVEGACSTSVDMGVVCGVEAKGAAIEQMDIDYLLVEANRDWNA